MGKNTLNALWGRYCCECLGEICQIDLRRKDCLFSQLGVGTCCHCGEAHHLVMDVRFIAKCRIWLQLLFGKEQ